MYLGSHMQYVQTVPPNVEVIKNTNYTNIWTFNFDSQDLHVSGQMCVVIWL